MEALLEREEQVENWNDDRLDELSQTTKEGFAKVDREMKEGFAKVDEGFAQINRKLDQLPTREEIDQRFGAVAREVEAADRRIDRVNSRLEHMVWAMLIVGGGFLGNLLTDKI